MFKNILLIVISFLLSSCLAHNYNPPVCKCECKCPNENKNVDTNVNKTSNNENFLTDDTTIKDILGDR